MSMVGLMKREQAPAPLAIVENDKPKFSIQQNVTVVHARRDKNMIGQRLAVANKPEKMMGEYWYSLMDDTGEPMYHCRESDLQADGTGEDTVLAKLRLDDVIRDTAEQVFEELKAVVKKDGHTVLPLKDGGKLVGVHSFGQFIWHLDNPRYE